MKRILVASIALASLGLAQETPTAEQVLASYVKALGGADKLNAVTTRVAKGTVDNPDDGSTSPVEIQAKAPGFYSSVTRFSDQAVYRTVLAGDAGWMQDPDSGVRPMNRSEVSNARLDNDFHRPLHLATLYSKLGPPKRGKLADKDAWTIEAATAKGEVETWWFDAATGLLASREFERVSLDEGIIKIQEFYEDYKEFGGILMPARIRRVMPDYQQTYLFSEIGVNVPVEDSVFAKPQ